MERSALKGANAYFDFAIRDAEGTLAAPESLPTITGAQLNGTAIATTNMTVVQAQDSTPANITGRYYVRVASTVTTGWADGDTGVIYISATINGYTRTEEIRFRVTAIAAQRPYIDVN